MAVLPLLPKNSKKVLFATLLIITLQASCIVATAITAREEERSLNLNGSKEIIETTAAAPLHQINCTGNPTICNDVCDEPQGSIPYTSTFCDTISGSCICDCRDSLRKDCKATPFTPCFQDCVRKNPNPDVFLYEGGNCPISTENGTVVYQCACGCSVRDDYEETNDIF